MISYAFATTIKLQIINNNRDKMPTKAKKKALATSQNLISSKFAHSVSLKFLFDKKTIACWKC